MNTINYLTREQAKSIEASPAFVWKKFKHYTLSNTDVADNNVDNVVSVLLLYSVEHLYVFIKSNQTSIVHRDRAYQNGDGFHFVLAKPTQTLSATDEFYVIAISPLATDKRKHFIWYYNVDFAGKALEKTQVSHVIDHSGVTFMVRIPWEEIPPLKPFSYETYGFNARYIQAVPKGKNIYTLKADPQIDSEQSLREYVLFDFEAPTEIKEVESAISVDRKHVTKGQVAYIKYAVTALNASTLHLSFTNQNRLKVEKSIALKPGFNKGSMPIDTDMLDLGYNDLDVLLSIDTYKRKYTFSLYHYDLNEYSKLNKRINELTTSNVSERLLKESITTLKFYAQQLVNRIEKLKPYERFLPIEEAYLSLKKKVASVEAKRPIIERNRFVRLAYQSDMDQTLQPYTLYIPKTTNESTRLFVYLHGSGSDDRSVKSNPRFVDLAEDQNVIILAPYARGTSHFYCTDASQKDIIEITKKTASLFNIDKSNIILSGFSMGGYGVYRVYDEAPSLFSKLVIISGHHGIGSMVGGPDYGTNDAIKRFSDVPMIIFHGTADLNCSYEESQQFFSKVQSINPNVDINIKEGLGHSGLIDDWQDILSRWLSNDEA